MMYTTFAQLMSDNQVSRFSRRFHSRRWAEVEDFYNEVFEKFEKKLKEFTKRGEELSREWGEFAAQPAFISTPDFTFRTPDEANLQISRFMMEVDSFNEFNLYREAQLQSRKKWVDSLIASAPADCKLVVIKGKYTPYETNAESFDKACERGEASSINIMCMAPIWVSFDPNKGPDNIQYWCMGLNSSVSYL